MSDDGAQPAHTQSLALRDVPAEIVYRLKQRQLQLAREMGRAITISEIGEAALVQWLASGGHLTAGTGDRATGA